jgi:hypothetical protein
MSEASEMVERFARLLHRQRHGDPDASPAWRRYVADASELIAAMRVPTEAMQLAGHNKRNDPATGLPTSCGTDEIYTAMIDAALSEGGGDELS